MVCEWWHSAWFHLLAMALLNVWNTLPVDAECFIVTIFGLKTAKCDNLNMKIIPKDMDRDIKKLEFRDNQITHLEMDEFQNYGSLQEIYFTRNRIEIIAPDAFRGLYNLQILDLEGNKLKLIPTPVFKHLASVRIFSMKSNPIRFIPEHAFSSLRNIEKLSYENCWLDRIHPRAFQGLHNLDEINLVNNELKSLGAEMQKSLPTSLTVFRLYENPWVCDCKLRWLREWISTTAVNWDFNRNTPACSGPDSIRGINWKHLKPEQFACATRIISNSSTSLQLEVRSNVSIECVAYGNPEPEISWLKGTKYVLPDLIEEKHFLNEEGEQHVRSTLTLVHAMLTDAGDYTCVAENFAGRDVVTYKLWIKGLDKSDAVITIFGLSTEAIIGIAVGGGIIILLIVFIALGCFLHQRYKQRHAYRVRDYKKAENSNAEPTSKNGKDPTYSVDEDEVDCALKVEKEKQLATVTTELLPEKKKEVVKQKTSVAPIIKAVPCELSLNSSCEVEPVAPKPPPNSPKEPKPKHHLPNNIHEAEGNEFKMKIFSSYRDSHLDGRTHTDKAVIAAGGAGDDLPGLCNQAPAKGVGSTAPNPAPVIAFSACNGAQSKGAPQPDLVCRDKQPALSNHIPKPPPPPERALANHIQSSHKRAQENPYAKPCELKSAMKKKSGSSENLLNKNDREGRGDSRSGTDTSDSDTLRKKGSGDGKPAERKSRTSDDGTRGTRDRKKTRSRELSPCTNPVCLKDQVGSPTSSSEHGSPCHTLPPQQHIKNSHSLGGLSQLSEENGASDVTSPSDSGKDMDQDPFADKYRTLPTRPHTAGIYGDGGRSRKLPQNPYHYTPEFSPTKSSSSASGSLQCSPSKLGRPRLTQQQHPTKGNFQMEPQIHGFQPGQPLDSYTYSHTLHRPKVVSSPPPGSRSQGVHSSTLTPRTKSERAYASTSLDDILSPPFGLPADGKRPSKGSPVQQILHKPGESDEFGTAV